MHELTEVYRNSVQTWECDQMGHLNVQFYVAKATSALNSFAVHLGLGPGYQRSTGARLIAEDHHIRFLREQHAGVPIVISAGVLAVNGDRLQVYEEMTNAITGEVAATFTANTRLVDCRSRSPLPLPSDAAAAARRYHVELPAHGAPRGVELTAPRPAPTLELAQSMGLKRSYEGEALPGLCEPDGFLATGAYMSIVSDAYPNIFALAGISRNDSDIGGAALEYRFIYREAPQRGDVLTLRSAVKGLTEKTYTFCHWLFNAETGACVATAEVVAVALDLKARRAVAMSSATRAKLQTLQVPELTI